MPPLAFVRRLSLTAALLAAAACSLDPYPVDTQRQPPWQIGSVDTLPAADPYPVGTLRQPQWQLRTADELRADELRADDPRIGAGSSDPYSIGTLQRLPWREGTADPPPAADPRPGAGPQRFAFCYARPFNDEVEVRALAEERCGGGQLIVEDRDAFWNGCGLLQPMRITYACHPVATLPQSE